jgi:hypothetical protein
MQTMEPTSAVRVSFAPKVTQATLEAGWQERVMSMCSTFQKCRDENRKHEEKGQKQPTSNFPTEGSEKNSRGPQRGKSSEKQISFRSYEQKLGK